MADESTTKLIHLTCSFESADEDTKRRIDFARQTHAALYAKHPQVTPFVFHTETAHRTSKILGDERTVAFIKDVLDAAFQRGDRIFYTNADCCIVAEAADVIQQHLNRLGCCFGFRVECPPPLTTVKTYQEINRRPLEVCTGADLIGMTSQWWGKHKAKYPDFLIGCAGWDNIMMNLMRASRFHSMPHLIYHEKHPAYWKQHLNNVGQVYNMNLFRKWRR